MKRNKVDDKTIGAWKESRDYEYAGGKLTQEPLLTEQFEAMLEILDEVGVDAIVSAAAELQQFTQVNAGKEVALNLSDLVSAAMGAMSKIGRGKLLTKTNSVLFDVELEVAGKVPMSVTRLAIVDFFHLNADWLPDFRAFTALVTAR